MQPVLLIRLRPSGPWRYGPGDGADERVDSLYRSDRLFSALTLAMYRLELLDEWLDATARASEPAVVFSSLYPFQGETLFAIPPATAWPPPSNRVTAPNSVFLAKIRWTTAQFIPLSLIDTLLTGGSVLADQWIPDVESGCLLRRDRPSASPFRVVGRRRAPVDRVSNITSLTVSSSCVEFELGAGLWTAARFRDQPAETVWKERIQSAFRLLAESGFGGRRSSGWGHTEAPEFQQGSWPAILLPKVGRSLSGDAQSDESRENSQFWLLSIFSPAPADVIDWAAGEYRTTVRSGRVESPRGSGAEKKSVRMITEGSVLMAQTSPAGTALDVSPEGFEHPIYRAGFALTLRLPATVAQTPEELRTEAEPVEAPTTEEAVIEAPCKEKEMEPAHEETSVKPQQSEPLELLLQPEAVPQPDPETESEPPIPVESISEAIEGTGANPETDDPAEPEADTEEPGHAL